MKSKTRYCLGALPCWCILGDPWALWVGCNIDTEYCHTLESQGSPNPRTSKALFLSCSSTNSKFLFGKPRGTLSPTSYLWRRGPILGGSKSAVSRQMSVSRAFFFDRFHVGCGRNPTATEKKTCAIFYRHSRSDSNIRCKSNAPSAFYTVSTLH